MTGAPGPGNVSLNVTSLEEDGAEQQLPVEGGLQLVAQTEVTAV